jgi:hypothetical protein
VALGVAMGAFRGLFVNYLWIRATKLKEEGKFYEAIELSSAITRLQPRFPRVWAFHAWNMAYNISVATNTAAERWEWVNAGIRLLRNQGIPKNPNDLLLHKELAWIYVHKIQGYMDEANRYYKRELAREWSVVLGSPPTTAEDDTAAATKTMVEWLRPIIEAPDTLQQVIDKEIAERTAVMRPGDDPAGAASKVAELVEKLKDAGLPKGKELGMDLLRFVLMHDSYKGAWYASEGSWKLREGVRNTRVDELRDDESFADAWTRLLPWIRRRVLIDEYRMEPDRMLRYIEKFGPLDCRHPGSHAIYWSQRGVEETRDRLDKSAFNTLNTDRVTSHALQELWRSGTLIYDPVTNELVTLNNLNYTETYGRFLQEDLWVRQAQNYGPMRAYELNNEGYENFLRDVIRVYFRRGELAKANEYFRTLRKADWKNINNPDKADELSELTLEEFVKKQLAEDRLSVPQVAASETMGALRDAFYSGLLKGDPKLFKSNYEYAAIVHRVYFEQKQTVRTAVDTEQARMDEMPRDFLDVAGAVFLSMLVNQDMEPLNAAAIYRKAPDEIRLRIYDPLSRMLVPNAMPMNRFASLFPEPPGLEAFRAAREKAREQGEVGTKRQLQLEQQ